MLWLLISTHEIEVDQDIRNRKHFLPQLSQFWICVLIRKRAHEASEFFKR